MDDFEKKKRLDVHILELFPALSRASVQKLIAQGRVTVNREPETKAGYKVKANDKIKVDYDPDNLPAIPSIELPILYEDNDCVVIDKPVGLLSHSKGPFNPEPTVATWLQEKYYDTKPSITRSDLVNEGGRIGIVHRLDRATSGVMICAKTPDALSWLQKQFSTRKVKKMYTALIPGELDPPEAIIEMPIERNPASPQRFRVGVNGKSASTHYKAVKTLVRNGISYNLLELMPATGRTHQLRVHLAHLGHPIVGDTFYDGETAERLYLHASKLEITLPNKERKVFVSKLPNNFKLN